MNKHDCPSLNKRLIENDRAVRPCTGPENACRSHPKWKCPTSPTYCYLYMNQLSTASGAFWGRTFSECLLAKVCGDSVQPLRLWMPKGDPKCGGISSGNVSKSDPSTQKLWRSSQPCPKPLKPRSVARGTVAARRAASWIYTHTHTHAYIYWCYCGDI